VSGERRKSVRLHYLSYSFVGPNIFSPFLLDFPRPPPYNCPNYVIPRRRGPGASEPFWSERGMPCSAASAPAPPAPRPRCLPAPHRCSAQRTPPGLEKDSFSPG
jgi:hypothetical protein